MEIKFLFSKTYDFLLSLDDSSVARINRSLSLLEKYGNTAAYPHTKYLAQGIFELRVIGVKHIRIFFVYRNDEVMVLHALIKKTNKIPKKEIDYVLQLKKRLR